AGAAAPGAGPGLRGLPRVGSQLSIPPGGGRRSAAHRATLASTGSRACVWPRTCSRPGALGRQRARGHRLVGREPRRAARSRRGDDALAAAARARGRGCSARRAAWHAGGLGRQPDPTMTLTTTTLGGETGGLPLLESGVIAVVRAPEAARLRAVARARAAGGVGAGEITLATPGPFAMIAGHARERSRVDPRRRRCGERGRRAVARGAARPRERRRADRAGAAAGDAGQSGAHMRAVTFGELLLRLSPPGDERLLESPELHTCF